MSRKWLGAESAIALIVVLILVHMFLISPPEPEESGPVITTSATKFKNVKWRVTGQILGHEDFTGEIKIWAIARDDIGNQYGISEIKSNAQGVFVIDPIPILIDADADKVVRTIEIFVRGSTSEGKILEARKKIDLTGWGSSFRHRIFAPILWIILSTVIFVASIVCAIVLWGYSCTRRDCIRGKLYAKYLVSVFLAVAFTLTTIMWISTALYKLEITRPNNDIYSIGFITIYKGKYVKDTEKEWLVSLTSPNTKTETISISDPMEVAGSGEGDSGSPAKTTEVEVIKDIQKGMGAPLWVVLLAVVGASLFTIILMIKTISDLPDYFRKLDNNGKPLEFNLDDRKKIRKKIEIIVRHQFFILFAPIGAVFVYQLLIISQAAFNQTTVALAALASGVTPYWLLNKALKTVGGILEAKEEDVSEMAKNLLDMEDRVGKLQKAEDKRKAIADAEKKVIELIDTLVEKLTKAKGDEGETGKILTELSKELTKELVVITADHKAAMEKIDEVCEKVKKGLAGKGLDTDKLVKDLKALIIPELEKTITKPPPAEDDAEKDKTDKTEKPDTKSEGGGTQTQ
jgi:hypothetical protein